MGPSGLGRVGEDQNQEDVGPRIHATTYVPRLGDAKPGTRSSRRLRPGGPSLHRRSHRTWATTTTTPASNGPSIEREPRRRDVPGVVTLRVSGTATHPRNGRTHDNRCYVKLSRIARAWCSSPDALGLGNARSTEGVGHGGHERPGVSHRHCRARGRCGRVPDRYGRLSRLS
jgi:hypothetical protein